MSQTTPELHNHEDRRPVSPEFQIGQPGLTHEFVRGGVRYLEWLTTGNESEIAEIADWASLPHEVDDAGVARLVVPEGTRNATSVLSGKEAWRGEKEEILGAIVRYTQATREYFDGVDTSVALDTVGVTKEEERRIFPTPPHRIRSVATDQSAIEQWMIELVHDLDQVLRTEPRREELISDFFRGLSSGKEDFGNE